MAKAKDIEEFEKVRSSLLGSSPSSKTSYGSGSNSGNSGFTSSGNEEFDKLRKSLFSSISKSADREERYELNHRNAGKSNQNGNMQSLPSRWKAEYSSKSLKDIREELDSGKLDREKKDWLQRYIETDSDFHKRLTTSELDELISGVKNRFNAAKGSTSMPKVSGFDPTAMDQFAENIRQDAAYGTDKKDLEGRLKALGWSRNLAERREKAAAYDVNREDPAFQRYAQQGRNGEYAVGEDLLGDYLNHRGYENQLGQYGDLYEGAKADTQSSWGQITEDEKDMYYYLLASKGGREARKYLEDLQVSLDERAFNERKDSLKETYENSGAAGKAALNAVSVGANVMGNPAAVVSDVRSALSGSFNPYSNGHVLQQLGSEIREMTAQDIVDAVGTDTASKQMWGKIAANTYQGIMSGVDSAVGAAAFGRGYTALMGSGAASQRAKELYEAGASDGEMYMGAIASGAIEAAFEYISIDKFMDRFMEGDIRTLGAWVKNTVLQGLVEGSEEVNTEIANMIANSVILGANADNEREIRELRNSGLTQEEATKQAAMNRALDIMWAGYGGLVSGAGMGLVGGAVNGSRNAVEYHNTGSAIVQAGTRQALVEAAQNAPGYESNRTLKRLADKVGSEATENTTGFFATQKAGRLYAETMEAQVKGIQNAERSVFREALADELSSRGINGGQVLMDTLEKAAYEDDMSRGEKKLFQSIGGKEILQAVAQSDSFQQKAEQATADTRKQLRETASLTVDTGKLSKMVDMDDLNVSTEGKTLITKEDGSTVDGNIRGVRSSGGQLVLELEDGSTVNPSQVSFATSGEAAIYTVVSGMKIPAASANALIQSAPDGDAAAQRYAFGIQEMYRYGALGIPMNAISNAVFSGSLTQAQRRTAYNLGRDAYIASSNAAKENLSSKTTAKRGEGKVTFEGDESKLTTVQRTSLKALRTVAQALGVNIEVFQSETADGKHIGENGSYDPATGTIRIDLYAGQDGKGTMLFTAAHELTHFMKEWSPDKYQVFTDFLMQNYADSSVPVDVLLQRQIQKAQRNGRTISREAAMEEVVADSCEQMLADGKAIERMAQLRAKDAGVFEKVRNYIHRLSDKIRKVYEGMKPDSMEARYVSTMMEAFDQLRELWTQGVADAAENYEKAEVANNTNADNDSFKYQIRYPSYSEGIIRENKKALMLMEPVQNISADKLMKTGKRPSDLFQEFFESLGGNIYSEEFGDIALPKSSVKSEVRHGITSEKIASIEAIPNVISQGKVIFCEKKSPGGPERIVTAAPIQIGETPYLMGVMLQRDAQNQRLYLHNVVIKSESTNSEADHLVTTGPYTENDTLFMTRILQDAMNVKRDSVKLSDRESADEVRQQWDEEAKAMEVSHKYDMAEQKKELTEAHKEEVKALNASHKAEVDQLHRQWDEEVEAIRQSMKYDAEAELDRVLKNHADSRKAAAENRRRTEYRQRIHKMADQFHKMATAPGKADTAHAPVGLMNALARFCNIFAESEQHALQMAEKSLKGRELSLKYNNERLGITKGRQLEAETIQRVRERNSRKAESISKMQERYAEIQKDPALSMFYDEHVQSLLDSLSKELSGTDVYEMDTNQLEQVHNTMQAMLYTITNANRVFSMGKDKTLIGVTKKMGGEIDEVKVNHNELMVKMRRYWQWQMSPDTFFSYICGFAKNNEGKAVQKMFSDGTARMLGVQRDFYNAFRHLTEAENEATSKAIREMMGHPMRTMVDWGLKDSNGHSVKTSRGMMLQAYMLLSQKDSFESLVMGGFKLPRAEDYYKGKIEAAYGDADESSLLSSAVGEEYSSIIKQIKELQSSMEEGVGAQEAMEIEQKIQDLREQAVSLTTGAEERLIQIRETIGAMLTQTDRDLLATAAQWYKHSGELMSEVYLQMYGYKPKLVENYVPIHRDLTTVNVDIRNEKGEINLENSGFTKDRVHSTAPILLTDFFQELSTQQERMSRYYGFAQVQKDFNRIWNLKVPGSRTSINAKVSAKYGTGKTVFGVSGESYINNYIAAVSGANSSEDVLSSFYGNAASATLSLNPRVALSQLASIPTASAVVGWKSMGVGFAKGLSTSLSAEKKNQLMNDSVWFYQRYRGAGGSTEFADLKMKGTVWGKISGTSVGKALFNWCQAFDVFATASMWAMAEDRVQSTTSLKPNSEGYQAAVEQCYADIIRKSQPNYTTTERSDLLRDKRGGMKLLTMYKTQSNANLNILISANGEYKRMKQDFMSKKNGVTKADVNAAAKQLANGITSVTLGGTLVFVLLRTLVNFALGKVDPYRDEETDEVTLEETMKAMAKEAVSSSAGMFALGGQLYDLLESAISHERYYGISDSAISSISSAVESFQSVLSNALDPDKDVTGKQLWKTLKSTLALAGVPAGNAESFLKAADMWYRDYSNGELGAFSSGETTNKQYEARFLQAYKNGEDERCKEILAVIAANSDEWNDARTERKTASNMKTFLKEKYINGAVTKEEAADILHRYFGVSDTDAKKLLNEWQGILDTGRTADQTKDAYFNKAVSSSEYVTYLTKYMGKSSEDAKTAELKLRCERDEGIIYSDIEDLIQSGKLNHSKAVQLFVKYGGMNKEKAENHVTKQEWKREIPGMNTSIGEETIAKYTRYCQSSGVSKSMFYNLWEWKKNHQKKAELVEYIASLRITDGQRASLWQAFRGSNWKGASGYAWTF